VKCRLTKPLPKEKAAGQIYKQELIEDLKTKPTFAEASAGEGRNTVSFYTVGKFMDLCKGPHIENTNQIPKGAWKLNKLAGAYWRGDEKK